MISRRGGGSGKKGRAGKRGQQVAGIPSPVLDGHSQADPGPMLPGSVFQLTHDVYKPFIFAADTLEDLSM